jgi:hypothetical protein
MLNMYGLPGIALCYGFSYHNNYIVTISGFIGLSRVGWMVPTYYRKQDAVLHVSPLSPVFIHAYLALLHPNLSSWLLARSNCLRLRSPNHLSVPTSPDLKQGNNTRLSEHLMWPSTPYTIILSAFFSRHCWSSTSCRHHEWLNDLFIYCYCNDAMTWVWNVSSSR